jgi:transposase
VAHATVEELGRAYRAARDVVQRGHVQLVWLVAKGYTLTQATQAVGISLTGGSVLLQRYNAGGLAALGDGRHAAPGRAPALDGPQRAALATAVGQGSPDGELWDGPQVARWIAAQTGHAVTAKCGWEYLRRLGFSPQVPRPRHVKADVAAQAAFKKTSPTR